MTYRIFGGAVSASCLAIGMASTVATAQTAAEVAAAQQDIWTKEQSIYEGRSRGDLTNYRNNLAPRYLSWPPTVPAPMDAGKFPTKPMPSKEKLTMELRGFSVNGDTAVIYYATHMTQNAAGDAVDLHYEVTHSWIRRDGKWMVFGGMARIAPKR